MNETRDNPSPLRQRRRRRSKSSRRRKWILAAFACVFLFSGIMWLAKKPVKTWWLARETAGHVQSAKLLMDKQEWQEASRVLVEAMSIAPDDPQVLRTFAELLKKAGASPTDQAQLLQRLVTRGNATPTDVTELASAELRRGDIDGARRALTLLPAAARSGNEVMQIEAAILKKQGRNEEAEALMRRALENLASSDPEARFKLAVLDFKQPHDVVHERGTAALWIESKADGPHRAEAIRLLASQANLKPDEATELVRLAENHDNEVRYAALTAFVRLHPEKNDETFRREHARASSAGEKGLTEYSRWLAMIGEHERLLKSLPAESLVKAHDLPPELLSVKLTVLARQGQWESVKRLVTPQLEKHLGVTAYHFWLACMHAREKDGADLARQHLRIMAETTGRGVDTRVSLQAAAISAQLQDWPLAASLCQAAAVHAPSNVTRTALLEKALLYQTSARDCGAMLTTAREIAQLTPGNEATAFRADYLALLAGDSIEVISARHSASRVLDDEAAAQGRLLQALSLYRLGTQVPREELLKDIPRAASWAPGRRAVFAALLATSGQTAAAFQLSESIQSANLLPEEQRLLKLAR